MKLGTVFLGIAAVALAVVGGLMVQAAMGTNAPQAPIVIPQRRIAVAANDIPAGTFLQASLIRWESYPENALRPEFLVDGKDNIEALSGSVIREALKAGENILRDRLVSPGDRGFLAAVLAPGMRAVSVAVNEVSGTAGLIFPGDRVDLLLTQEVAEPGAPRRLANETILENLRVIAVDQRVETGKPDDNGQAARSAARTVTLEVTVRQAQMISVAADLGRLTLALRSLAAPGSRPTPEEHPSGPIWASDVSAAAPRVPVPVAPEPNTPTVAKPAPPSIIRGSSHGATP